MDFITTEVALQYIELKELLRSPGRDEERIRALMGMNPTLRRRLFEDCDQIYRLLRWCQPNDVVRSRLEKDFEELHNMYRNLHMASPDYSMRRTRTRKLPDGKGVEVYFTHDGVFDNVPYQTRHGELRFLTVPDLPGWGPVYLHVDDEKNEVLAVSRNPFPY